MSRSQGLYIDRAPSFLGLYYGDMIGDYFAVPYTAAPDNGLTLEFYVWAFCTRMLEMFE